VVRLRRTGLASELQLNGVTSLHFESTEVGLQGASKVQLQVVVANDQWAMVPIVRNTPTRDKKLATVTMSYQM
jgi:hypothetical protein